MKKKILMILALLCAVVQGAWAQANWDEVYAMTQTTSESWTALTAGSTTGRTLGAAGTTTYCYADANLTFTNSTAGGSGLTILGTVYLYVPQGVTLTCTGANASGQTGAGAGIELTAGNTLYLIGKGTVNATGGNAANGGNGASGSDASLGQLILARHGLAAVVPAAMVVAVPARASAHVAAMAVPAVAPLKAKFIIRRGLKMAWLAVLAVMVKLLVPWATLYVTVLHHGECHGRQLASRRHCWQCWQELFVCWI